MLHLFTDHPASVGESYVEHMGVALTFAVTLLAAGCVCLGHAVLPFAFEKTGSRMVTHLHDIMVANRRRHALPAHAVPAE